MQSTRTLINCTHKKEKKKKGKRLSIVGDNKKVALNFNIYRNILA
jgi:hypothetical protein